VRYVIYIYITLVGKWLIVSFMIFTSFRNIVDTPPYTLHIYSTEYELNDVEANEEFTEELNVSDLL
jgi:hypothetical protein